MLNPSPARLAAARRGVTAFARERQRYARLRRLPAVTLDGREVELQANLELPIELPLVAQSGAHGIGQQYETYEVRRQHLRHNSADCSPRRLAAVSARPWGGRGGETSFAAGIDAVAPVAAFLAMP